MRSRSKGARRGMIRLHGYYLYEVGSKIHPVSAFRSEQTTYAEAYYPVIVAEGALEPLLYSSVFQLKASKTDGEALLRELKKLREMIEGQDADGRVAVMTVFDLYGVQTALSRFETVLSAEFGLTALYIVQKKGGLDTMDLMENGIAHWPADLPDKVPEAVPDIEAGARCLAFELNTAAGFHFHRANESVLHAYFDAVTGGAQRPKNRNMGDYLAELDRLKKGDDKVKSALRALKDLHRNPLIHPEHSLETTEEAISLLSQIRATVGYMLPAIPAPVFQSNLAAALAAVVPVTTTTP